MASPFASVMVFGHDTPMGHRLSKITTRTGDGGDTGLGDGSRVRKDSARVATLGEIDELNSAIGVLLAEPVPDKIRACLESIQHDLFDLGGDVSIPGRATMTQAQVGRLESLVDEMNAALPRLKEFILPGGTSARSSRSRPPSRSPTRQGSTSTGSRITCSSWAACSTVKAGEATCCGS